MTSIYQSVNPNTGKLLKSFEHLSHAQLEQQEAGAHRARRRTGHWLRTPPVFSKENLS
jgi:hypothetical protein